MLYMITQYFIDNIHTQSKYDGYQLWSTIEVISVLKLLAAAALYG